MFVTIPKIIKDRYSKSIHINEPSIGWQMTSIESITSPQGTVMDVDRGVLSEFYKRVTITQGILCEEVCIGVNGSQKIPLIVGSSEWQEAMRNTALLDNEIFEEDRIPGRYYLTDDGEVISWIGKLWRNTFIAGGTLYIRNSYSTRAFIHDTGVVDDGEIITLDEREDAGYQIRGNRYSPFWATTIFSQEEIPHEWDLVIEEADDVTGWHFRDGLFAFNDEHEKSVKVDERLGNLGIHSDVTGDSVKVSLRFGNHLSVVDPQYISDYYLSGNVRPIGRTFSEF